MAMLSCLLNLSYILLYIHFISRVESVVTFERFVVTFDVCYVIMFDPILVVTSEDFPLLSSTVRVVSISVFVFV